MYRESGRTIGSTHYRTTFFKSAYTGIRGLAAESRKVLHEWNKYTDSTQALLQCHLTLTIDWGYHVSY